MVWLVKKLRDSRFTQCAPSLCCIFVFCQPAITVEPQLCATMPRCSQTLRGLSNICHQLRKHKLVLMKAFNRKNQNVRLPQYHHSTIAYNDIWYQGSFRPPCSDYSTHMEVVLYYGRSCVESSRVELKWEALKLCNGKCCLLVQAPPSPWHCWVGFHPERWMDGWNTVSFFNPDIQSELQTGIPLRPQRLLTSPQFLSSHQLLPTRKPNRPRCQTQCSSYSDPVAQKATCHSKVFSVAPEVQSSQPDLFIFRLLPWLLGWKWRSPWFLTKNWTKQKKRAFILITAGNLSKSKTNDRSISSTAVPASSWQDITPGTKLHSRISLSKK